MTQELEIIDRLKKPDLTRRGLIVYNNLSYRSFFEDEPSRHQKQIPIGYCYEPQFQFVNKFHLSSFNWEMLRFKKNVEFLATLTKDQMVVAREMCREVEKLKKKKLPTYLCLQAKCGFGKTILLLFLLSKIGLRTYVITHTKVLADQFKERVDRFLTGVTSVSSRDGAVELLKKLRLDNLPDILIFPTPHLREKAFCDLLAKYYGMGILDEAHYNNLSQNKSILENYLLNYISPFFISVTATPRGSNSLYFGKHIFTKDLRLSVSCLRKKLMVTYSSEHWEGIEKQDLFKSYMKKRKEKIPSSSFQSPQGSFQSPKGCVPQPNSFDMSSQGSFQGSQGSFQGPNGSFQPPQCQKKKVDQDKMKTMMKHNMKMRLISYDPNRRYLVLLTVRYQHRYKNARIVLLVRYREEAAYYADALADIKPYVSTDTNQTQTLEQYMENKDQFLIIGTLAKYGVGTDFPRCNILILTTLTKNEMDIEQWAGRCLREKIVPCDTSQVTEGNHLVPGVDYQVTGRDHLVTGKKHEKTRRKQQVNTLGQHVPGGNLPVPGNTSHVPQMGQHVSGGNLSVPGNSSHVPQMGQHVPGGNLPVPGNNLCLPGNTSHVPHMGQHVPGENLPVPCENLPAPGNISHVPQMGQHVPGGNLPVPGSRSHVPQMGQHVPGNNLCLPGNTSHVPQMGQHVSGGNLPVPGNTSHVPENNLCLPGNTSHVPHMGQHVPGDNLPVPGNTSHVPDGNLPVPGNTSHVPDGNLPVPGNTSYVPGGNLPVPGNTSHVPQMGQQVPGENLCVPGNNLCIPGNTSHVPQMLPPVVFNTSHVLHMGQQVPGHNLPVPQMGQQVPHMGQQVPQMGQQVPQMGQQVSGHNLPVPQMGQQVPGHNLPVPQMGQQVPHMGQQVSGHNLPVPQMGQQVPHMGQQVPGHNLPVPQMGQQVSGHNLPVPQMGQHVSGENLPVPGKNLPVPVPTLTSSMNQLTITPSGENTTERPGHVKKTVKPDVRKFFFFAITPSPEININAMVNTMTSTLQRLGWSLQPLYVVEEEPTGKHLGATRSLEDVHSEIFRSAKQIGANPHLPINRARLTPAEEHFYGNMLAGQVPQMHLANHLFESTSSRQRFRGGRRRGRGRGATLPR